jgi:hypothetical protein
VLMKGGSNLVVTGLYKGVSRDGHL